LATGINLLIFFLAHIENRNKKNNSIDSKRKKKKLQIKKRIHVKKRIWLSQTQGYIGKRRRKATKVSKLLTTLALFFIFILFHYSPSSFFSGRSAHEWGDG
jgi:hypothetical protein